jgi:uncharacterized sulfatase
MMHHLARTGTAVLFLCLVAVVPRVAAEQATRPNILWITSEDNGPHLGCYGDQYADSPNIDRLAGQGVIYLNCWSTAPVCAPARTTLISGMYPPSTGSQHMRSMVSMPDGFKMYPQYLRAAGYYCTNNSKEDYNLVKPEQVWDESSRNSHWKNRQPGQPFFAIFNFTTSHESQIRKRPHEAVHDPEKVRVPAYHPDTPEVRRDWAQYYDKITEMDRQVGGVLDEIEKAGLADDTIVFYYGDHGSGMPRSKRWPYNSGLRVPLVVHVPAKWRDLASADYEPGGKTDRLVGFIDFAPTLLSLAGVKPPKHFQGHAFMGQHEAEDQPYLFGFRGRMDERYDMLRVVRNKRYILIRNYMPHKIYGQYIAYMFQTPTTRVWKEMYDAGKLETPATFFWETKSPLELYDLENDPDEIHNLADSPDHQEIVRELRRAQRRLALRIRDLGFLPESEIHERSAQTTPYELGHDEDQYPLDRILAMAEKAALLRRGATAALTEGFSDPDSAVRYWAAMGLLMRGKKGVAAGQEQLLAALDDDASSVQVAAAEALGRYGNSPARKAAEQKLLEMANLNSHSVFIVMAALNALDAMDERAAAARDAIQALPTKSDSVTDRMGAYVDRLVRKTLADLQE